jgi:hypothetical protein
VSHRRPESLASLATLVVAKLRPKSDAASLIRAAQTGKAVLAEGPASLAKRLQQGDPSSSSSSGGGGGGGVGCTPAEALEALGVARLVAEEDGGVELIDDDDVRCLRSGAGLTVHWATAPDGPFRSDDDGHGDADGSLGGMLLRQRR